VQQKLSFVIAGAQKGGTTTLDAIFRRHPQIQMASIKELHFFDDESHDWGVPDYSKVDAYFPAADQRLRGEATPVTLYWRPATRRLRQYNSEIKLILLLRNPVERAYSNWRMEYTNGRETQLFSDAIRQGRDRVRSEAEVEGLHRYFSYVERGFYGRQLANLLELFPKRQIHCELSEEFFDDPSTTLQRLSTFLAIPPFPVIPPLHENPGRLAGYPSPLSKDDRAYLSALFADDIAAVEAFLGRSISRWKNLEGVPVIGSPR
jgi:Sulfotransferase domain